MKPMMREDIVFGPIHSRRLGHSLGINLLPRNGKLCNFDCIYCECGWNRDGRGDRALPSARDLEDALAAKLRECVEAGVPIDSITFSGDGEPTLNPDFPEIIDITVALRDRWYPEARISVLSNATMAWKDEVFDALRKVDNPIMKLDVVDSLMRFEGDFILQTMFLKCADFDSSSPEVLQGWMDLVRKLRPREIMVYTLDRPAPMQGLEKFTVEEMAALVKPLSDEGFNIQIRG